jgi:hypothetical protein
MEDFSGIKWRFQSDMGMLIPLLIVAVLIGLLTGFLAVGFRYLLLIASTICWQNSDIIGSAVPLPWMAVVLIPLAGGLLVGPIVSRLAPETRGAGVPEVIHAVASKQGIIRHGTTFYKILSTVISIGSGASVGRQGRSHCPYRRVRRFFRGSADTAACPMAVRFSGQRCGGRYRRHFQCAHGGDAVRRGNYPGRF